MLVRDMSFGRFQPKVEDSELSRRIATTGNDEMAMLMLTYDDSTRDGLYRVLWYFPELRIWDRTKRCPSPYESPKDFSAAIRSASKCCAHCASFFLTSSMGAALLRLCLLQERQTSC